MTIGQDQEAETAVFPSTDGLLNLLPGQHFIALVRACPGPVSRQPEIPGFCSIVPTCPIRKLRQG